MTRVPRIEFVPRLSGCLKKMVCNLGFIMSMCLREYYIILSIFLFFIRN